jgi:nucleotide-binding universal stress UspA family protein
VVIETFGAAVNRGIGLALLERKTDGLGLRPELDPARQCIERLRIGFVRRSRVIPASISWSTLMCDPTHRTVPCTTMIRSILIGLDGSTDSVRAVEQGIRWSKLTGAELIGVGVVDEPTIRRPEPTGAWGSHFKHRRDEALLADAREKVKSFLTEFARRCGAAGVRHRLREEIGLPTDRILHLNEEADLTLLGRESHFRFETQTTADDTLEEVLRRAERPVVAIPDQEPKGRAVLVAYDASPAAARALATFANSGLDEGRPVRIVSVAADMEIARRRTEEAVRYLNHYNIHSDASPLVGRKASEGLLATVRECNPGIVVMGAFGGQRSEGYFGRSTTRRILREARVPLFLHP